jgi:hypothetical protein
MKFKYKKTVVVEEEVHVDDRVYNDESMTYRIANIILDGRLNYVYDDLYDKDPRVINNAAEKLNEAFKKADDILKLMD